MWAIGEMKIEKNTGPRTAPCWGTPPIDEITDVSAYSHRVKHAR